MKLIDEINAACTPEQISQRNDVLIAELVNKNRAPIIGSRMIGCGLILDTLGAVAGTELLDTIESLRDTAPYLKYVWVLLAKSELDVGMPSVRAGLDTLVSGGVIPAEQAEKLKALAEFSDLVDYSDIPLAFIGVK